MTSECLPRSPDRLSSISVIPLLFVGILAGNICAQNLIVNGDFEQGNTAFTSDYTYSPQSGYAEKTYTVTSNPSSWHPSFSPCGDHSSGSGLMLAVNGAVDGSSVVWSQTVPVAPGGIYQVELWAASLSASSPAQLQVLLDGVPLGSILTLPAQTCSWQLFSEAWSGPSGTSATISIVDTNPAYSGNDFAIDDISMTRLPPLPPPTISSVTPSAGPLSGMPITIHGSGFLSPSATEVRICGQDVLCFTITSDTQIAAIAPPVPCSPTPCSCKCDVEVENANGIGLLPLGLTYSKSTFLLSTVPPNALLCGPAGQVSLLGANFLVDPANTIAWIAGAPLPNQQIVSDTVLVGSIPQGASSGPVTVTVSNTCGTASLPAGFTYLPILTSSGTPSIGSTFNLGLQGVPGDGFVILFSLVASGGLSTPPFCGQLALDPVFLFPLLSGVLSSGNLTVPFPIPGNPLLVGVPMHFQALEANLGPLLGAWSDLLSVTITP